MIYNVYMRIADASRECGWTQVWIDSFAKYNDAVVFVMQYRSPNMLPDRMLAVTANKHDGAYDDYEVLLAAGMLETEYETGREYIGIVSDEFISAVNSPVCVYAKNLMDGLNDDSGSTNFLDNIRRMQRRSPNFHKIMVAINLACIEETLSLDKRNKYPFVEESVMSAKEYIAGKPTALGPVRNFDHNAVYRSSFEEDIHSAAFYVDDIFSANCIYYCHRAAKYFDVNLNKDFKSAMLRVVTIAQCYCDMFFSGE